MRVGGGRVEHLRSHLRHRNCHAHRSVHERWPGCGPGLRTVRARLLAGRRASHLQAVCCGGDLPGRDVANGGVVHLPERQCHSQRHLR